MTEAEKNEILQTCKAAGKKKERKRSKVGEGGATLFTLPTPSEWRENWVARIAEDLSKTYGACMLGVISTSIFSLLISSIPYTLWNQGKPCAHLTSHSLPKSEKLLTCLRRTKTQISRLPSISGCMIFSSCFAFRSRRRLLLSLSDFVRKGSVS